MCLHRRFPKRASGERLHEETGLETEASREFTKAAAHGREEFFSSEAQALLEDMGRSLGQALMAASASPGRGCAGTPRL